MIIADGHGTSMEYKIINDAMHVCYCSYMCIVYICDGAW